MPEVMYSDVDGNHLRVDVPVGQTIMEGALANGVSGIEAQCCGNCACATCHVYIDGGWLKSLPPMSDDEDAMLEFTASDRLPNSRLSCQIRMTEDLGGIAVTTPKSQS